MARSLLGGARFKWGISIDDMWVYAGVRPPKSIIIPHLVTIGLPEGPYRFRMSPESSSKKDLVKEGRNVDSEISSQHEESVGDKTRLLCKILAHELKRSGIGFVRCWFQWNLFQPRIIPGSQQNYVFPLDSFVQEFNDTGIEIIAVVGNGYFRFLPQGINLEKPSDYLARLSEASTQIVRHYKGKISVWQIENEPNWWLEHFTADWRRGGIWFEKNIANLILDELHRIVHDEDPNTPTLINLEADSARAFMKSFSNYCEVLGIDFYPNYSHPSPIDLSGIRVVAKEARRLTEKPLIVAETGYPSGPRMLGYSESNQSQYIRSVCEEAHACDELTGLGVWRLSDTYWLSFPFQENHFGLLNQQGLAKPAWAAYVNQIREHIG